MKPSDFKTFYRATLQSRLDQRRDTQNDGREENAQRETESHVHS